MKSRPLGNSHTDASVIGFGAWAIGGWTWGGPDEQGSIRAIHAYSPLAQGLLTGKIDPGRKYPEDDQRRYKARFRPGNVIRRVLKAFRRLARKRIRALSRRSMEEYAKQPGRWAHRADRLRIMPPE